MDEVDRFTIVIAIALFSGFSLIYVVFSYDMWVDIDEQKIKSDKYLTKIYNNRYTCEELQERILSYDKYLLRSPSKILIDAERTVCEKEGREFFSEKERLEQ